MLRHVACVAPRPHRSKQTPGRSTAAASASPPSSWNWESTVHLTVGQLSSLLLSSSSSPFASAPSHLQGIVAITGSSQLRRKIPQALHKELRGHTWQDGDRVICFNCQCRSRPRFRAKMSSVDTPHCYRFFQSSLMKPGAVVTHSKNISFEIIGMDGSMLSCSFTFSTWVFISTADRRHRLELLLLADCVDQKLSIFLEEN